MRRLSVDVGKDGVLDCQKHLKSSLSSQTYGSTNGTFLIISVDTVAELDEMQSGWHTLCDVGNSFYAGSGVSNWRLLPSCKAPLMQS